jgi:hypothetical protein
MFDGIDLNDVANLAAGAQRQRQEEFGQEFHTGSRRGASGLAVGDERAESWRHLPLGLWSRNSSDSTDHTGLDWPLPVHLMRIESTQG